ncbi:MAG: homoserine O-succinyltransferase, partial [Veillonella sp.]|nr:homoserine O-succinyltransferase [Veillonella sp.]
MPITVVKDLPAIHKLAEENIFVMDSVRAETQAIRPLEILLVNLMPTKEVTETQILRALSNTPLQLNMTLLHTASHKATNTDEEYLHTFYRTFDQVKDKFFDGMIITGAPVELMPFESVDYWDELVEIMDWSEDHVFSTLYLCWGAQAGLYHHFGIDKQVMDHKLFGVYEHEIYNMQPNLLRGFDEIFWMPHSRHTTNSLAEVKANRNLEILAGSEVTGAAIVRSKDNKHIFVFGHAEYDRDTLKREYDRDRSRGLDIAVPDNYYPDDDPSKVPIVRWRSVSTLLYTNWLNYYV